VGVLGDANLARRRGIPDAVLCAGRLGVVPAHLHELSPPAVRGTFPGFTYQIGNLRAAANATIQAAIAVRAGHDYSIALALVAGAGAIAVALLIGFGGEAREIRMDAG